MDGNGQTLLHTAAYAGNTKVVKLLLSKGAAINTQDEHGWSPLLCAVSPGHFETALILIKAGADCSVASESDNNSLHYLARWPEVNEDYLNLMKLLVKGGCDANLQNQDGDTPLISLCQRNPKLEAIEQLLKVGANVNAVNSNGLSPLHIAIAIDNTPLVSKLIEHGADPEISPSSPHGTPLAYATAKQRPFAIALLTDCIKRKQLAITSAQNQKSPQNQQGQSQNQGQQNQIPSQNGQQVAVSGPRTLLVEVLEAKELAGTSDVYAVIRCGKQERRTQVAFQSAAPHWGESFRLDNVSPFDVELIVNLWSWHMAKSSVSLGMAAISISELTAPGAVIDEWATLLRTGTTRQPRGAVHIRIQTVSQTSARGPSEKPESGAARFTFTVNGRMAEMVTTVDSCGNGFVSIPFPREEWVQLNQPSAPFCVDPSCAADGYHIEGTAACTTHKHDPKYDFDSTASIPHYARNFGSNVPHSTIFGVDDNQPIVFSLEDTGSGSGGMRKLVMRTKKEDRRMLVPSTGKNEVAIIKAALPALSRVKMTCSRVQAAIDLLQRYEKLQTVVKYKFGLLYAHEGQSTEQDILNNRETSAGFNDFLEFIGTKVELKGFKGYNAGLDTKSGNTGTHSVYTIFGEGDSRLEIMFHVATMLPFQDHDIQKVERKRHIGNDVVVMIYKESNGPDDTISIPSFVSHFNHVFVIVSPVRQSPPPPSTTTTTTTTQQQQTQQLHPPPPPHLQKTHSQQQISSDKEYRVAIVSKSPVKPFPPFIPNSGNVFKKGEALRLWLLKKLINGERTAMEAPDFRGSMMGTRKTMLMAVIEACGNHK